MDTTNYEIKYLKYKIKYLELKDILGGSEVVLSKIPDFQVTVDFINNQTVPLAEKDQYLLTDENLQVNDLLIIFTDPSFFRQNYIRLCSTLDDSVKREREDLNNTLCGFKKIESLVKYLNTTKAYRIRCHKTKQGNDESTLYVVRELDVKTLTPLGETAEDKIIRTIKKCYPKITENNLNIEAFKKTMCEASAMTKCPGCVIFNFSYLTTGVIKHEAIFATNDGMRADGTCYQNILLCNETALKMPLAVDERAVFI